MHKERNTCEKCIDHTLDSISTIYPAPSSKNHQPSQNHLSLAGPRALPCRVTCVPSGNLKTSHTNWSSSTNRSSHTGPTPVDQIIAHLHGFDEFLNGLSVHIFEVQQLPGGKHGRQKTTTSQRNVFFFANGSKVGEVFIYLMKNAFGAPPLFYPFFLSAIFAFRFSRILKSKKAPSKSDHDHMLYLNLSLSHHFSHLFQLHLHPSKHGKNPSHHPLHRFTLVILMQPVIIFRLKVFDRQAGAQWRIWGC